MSNFSNQVLKYGEEHRIFLQQERRGLLSKTWELDLKEIYEKFLRYVPSGGKILDFGWVSSGWDSYYLTKIEYVVTASDESIDKVRSYVQHINLFDCNEKNMDNGVWCYNSWLPYNEKIRRGEIYEKLKTWE